MKKEIKIQTQRRYQLLNITEKIREFLKEGNFKEGLLSIFVPHSTAGLILTEDEENLKKDWLNFFEKIVQNLNFYHNRIDDNADSHLLSGLISQEKTIPVKDGKPLLGTWQEIFLAEFDGPRERKVIFTFIKENET